MCVCVCVCVCVCMCVCVCEEGKDSGALGLVKAVKYFSSLSLNLVKVLVCYLQDQSQTGACQQGTSTTGPRCVVVYLCGRECVKDILC